jgi:hypothetical protein
MPPVKVTAKKARLPERDYAQRSLLDKLGVKPGHRISVLGIEDSAFLGDLASRAPEFSRGRVREPADIILLAAENLGDLTSLKSLTKQLQKNGAIWIVCPKGQAPIREVDVIAAGKSAGLTDNKVCRFSDTHTALRFVIPMARR